MKTHPSLLTALLVMFSLISSAHAGHNRGKVGANAEHQTLIQIKRDWIEALQQGNLPVIERITAPDWMFTNPDGVLVPKAQSNEAVKARALTFTSWKIDDIAVHVNGDTAAVFTLQTQQVTLRGNAITGQFRATDTFVKRDGRWQCIASQVTRVSQATQ